MSLKDLFNKNIKNFHPPVKNVASASVGAESNEYVIAKQKEKVRFVPPVDFATASNFAKFGSAELYYEYAFKRIYGQYPYDGTLAEKQEFQNKSTHLDRYVFDNVYPRTNGYVKMGHQGFDGSKDGTNYYNNATTKEYIFIDGGIHTASGGMEIKPLSDTFDKSMVYDVVSGSRKASSLAFEEDHGCTVEFWMNKSAFNAKAKKEVIFDLYNQEGTSGGSFLSSHGRITLYVTDSDEFMLNWASGSSIAHSLKVSPAGINIDDGAWHHYAVSLKKSGSAMRTRFYKDGTLMEETGSSDAKGIGTIRGYSKGLIATIGALAAASGSDCVLGDGKLSASLDEFRYWKTERTPKEIGQNWFDQIGGGTNKHESNKHLGVYYKFNEGIVGDSAYDSSILDYSGRITNGEWIGYVAGARKTDSAMVLSGKAATEFKDPIVYSVHPTVSSSMTSYKISGSLFDQENTNLFYNLLPSWVIREDENENSNLKYLYQIMASYFDTLHGQIKHINRIKDNRYYGSKVSPNVLAKDALRDCGFVIPDLFVEASVVENFRGKDLNEIYSGDITKVKNQIYQNIYNNLLYLYKSKGTEKAFRNFFRCFGFDTELIKLNLYADGSTQLLKDNYEFKSVAKPVLNLNHPDNFGGTVFQTTSSVCDTSYIKASDGTDEATSAMTIECEFILPKKLKKDQTGYFATPFTASSLFGYHRSKTNQNDFSWHSTDDFSLRVYVLKDEEDSDHIRFRLTGSNINLQLTTDRYRHCYNNEKWLLAVRVYHEDYPFVNITGSTSGEYTVNFYGLSTVGNDIKRGPFSIEEKLTNANGKKALCYRKRMYVGAHRQDYTGSYIERSDAKISQLRFWQSRLSDEEIKQHSYDPTNYGLEHPMDSDNVFLYGGPAASYPTVELPKIQTLALHWDFDTVTGSSDGGKFAVIDRTSGSAELIAQYPTYGNIVGVRHDGIGQFFLPSSTDAVDKEFIYAAKKRNPENAYSSDGVDIIGDEQEAFFQDTDRNDNYFMFEKSPYSAVSDEMINMFASVKDFSRLIGAPVNRYRYEYKEMSDIRRMFFRKVKNIPDPEKYFEYFKWIDTAISFGISQMIPASAKFADGVRNIVESHILERNKYVEKFPLIAQKQSTEGTMKGVNQLLYNWETGHAPVHSTLASLPDNENCLWQKVRRRLNVLSADKIRDNIYKKANSKKPKLYDVATSTTYEGSTYAINSLTIPYKFSGVFRNTVHGGINYPINKNRMVVYEATRPHGPTMTFYGLQVPKNVMTVGTGDGQGLIAETVCNDKKHPNYKEKYNSTVIFGEYSSGDGTGPLSGSMTYKFSRKGIAVLPMNFVSQSIKSGYNKEISDLYKTNVSITNLHSDTTDRTNDVPMQGPFTETWVGGHQSRHVRLNKYDTSLVTEGGGATKRNLDDIYSRPEAFRLMLGEHTGSGAADGALGITPADYGLDHETSTYPDRVKKRATRFREEHAKRPVNIRNIPHDKVGNRVGNYHKRYEYISVAAGKKEMNLGFRSNSHVSNYLPSTMTASLPDTTHVMTMIGQAPWASGNVFGVMNNNRQPDKTPVVGVAASGTFSMRGRLFAKNGDRFTITGVDGYSAKNFVVNGTTGGDTHGVATGSSDADFWNNMDSAIDSAFSNSYAITYTSLTSSVGKSLEITGSGGTNYLSASNCNFSASEFTFASWIYYSGSGNPGRDIYIISTHSTKGTGYGFDLMMESGTEDIRAHMGWNRTSDESSTATTQWRLDNFVTNYANKWTHVACVFNSASSTDNLTLYLNGVSSSWTGKVNLASTFGGGGYAPNAFDKTLYVTNYHSGSNNEWQGRIDETQWWNAALSASAIFDVFNCSGSHRDIASFPRNSLMKAWWTFGDDARDGSGNTDWIYDQTESEHHLRLYEGNLANPAANSRYRFTTGITAHSTASFYLTGSSLGAGYNASFTTSSTCTFLSKRDLVGGVTPETQPDIVLAVMTSSFKNSSDKNETVITTRFSAPGGIEVQSPAYLDVYAREYSVHNALPYRNLTVRGKSSGEASTIRLNDHLGKRDGLLTHLTRHAGKCGLDSVYGDTDAAQFNGSDSYVEFGTAAEWDAIIGNNTGGGSTQIMTISCWVYKSEDSGALRIVDFGDTDISFYIDDNEKVWFKAKWNGGAGVWWNTNAVITHNTWHHVVVTYDANATGNNAIIYFDGGQHAPTETGTAPTGAWDGIATEGCYIGNDSGANEAFIKYLDEFAIWNRALSAGEIKQIYDAGRNKSLDVVGFEIYSNLQLWYKMGDIDDNEHRFYDQSGNGRHSLNHIKIKIVGFDNTSPAFVKQHRNRSKRLKDVTRTISNPIFKNTYDNGFVSSMLPRSDFQYSWVNESIRSDYNIYSGKQRVYGYAPYSGIISSSAEVNGEKGFVPALTFPTASEIYGERE